jgi:phosphatidate cytidylyltransferase
MRTRVISALVAVSVLIAIFLIWRGPGLFAICSICAVLAMFEYSRLTLGALKAPTHLRITFILLTILVLAVTVRWEASGILAVALISVVYLVMVLMTVNMQEELAQALQVQSMATLGFIYMGVFPAMIIRLLRFDKGEVWLLGLLAIVFAGDTFAYLVGSKFGKTKLLEAVSPKKTFEGAIGGLLGSALVGVCLGHFFLTTFPLWGITIIAIATGGFAQAGDLFESLLKRVADVKDSGAIMPGHGGMLDRLDGVIFAAPIYYILARLLF